MSKFTFKHIKDYLQNKLYPYTHSDAVYTDDEENKTLTDTLSEINRKINDSAVYSQADWNETDNTINSYIRNKPVSLPANGGDADTVGNISPENFSMKSDLDSHKNDILAHQELFNAKLSMDTAGLLLKEPSFEQSTGVLTFTRLNGTTLSFSIPKSLVFKSALFDDTAKQIIITWSDDSKSRIPVDGLIDVYTGSENDVIQITVNDKNIISAVMKDGSVTRTLLSTDVQADLRKAHIHSNKSTINKFSEDSNGNVLFNGTSISTESGTTDYTDLTNKPQINNIELSGNKSLSDLGIEAIGSADSALTNAKSYTDSVASSKVGIEHLTNHIKPDGSSITVTEDGTLSSSMRIDITDAALNLDTLKSHTGKPHMARYICRTKSGAANIINLPFPNNSFILDVDLMRFISNADYITRQVCITEGNIFHKYERWCINGAWTMWESQTTKVVPILANSDLNDYHESGFYCCGSNATAATLLNCPTQKSFSMIINNHTGAHPDIGNSRGTYQELTEFDGSSKKFFRNYYHSPGWYGWKRIYTTADPPPIANNLLATVTGTALDAVQGKVLNDKINALGRQGINIFEGIVEDWHGTNYLTIILSDEEKQMAETSGLTILFTFGGGNQAIGATNGNIFSSCYVNTLGIWNVGMPIIEGKLAFFRLVDSTLYVWCNAIPTYPLRKITLIKNI